MTQVIAHMILKERSWFMGNLIRSAIRSVAGSVDRFHILDNGMSGIAKGMLKECLKNDIPGKFDLKVDHEITSFAEMHNALLEDADDGDWMLWLDADEIHYRDDAKRICDAIRKGQFDDRDRIAGHFFHFCRDPRHYQRIPHRPHEFYRKKVDTKWVGLVHEQLSGSYGPPIDVHYHYCHFGYCKPREKLLANWLWYAERDGNHCYDLSGGPDLPNLDPERRLGSQFKEENLRFFDKEYPEDAGWLTDGTCEEYGITWTDEGQVGDDSGGDYLAPWRDGKFGKLKEPVA